MSLEIQQQQKLIYPEYKQIYIENLKYLDYEYMKQKYQSCVAHQVPGTTFSLMGRSASGTLKLGALLLYSPDWIRARISLCFFLTQLACCNKTDV